MALALAACAGGRVEPYLAPPQPAEPGFGAALPAGHTRYANTSLAALLTTLTHDTEWGAERSALLRYETPVRVALEGPGSGQYAPFLDAYLAQIARRSGIDIARAAGRAGGGGANMFVRFVDTGDFQALLPSLSCVVVPGDLTWAVFAADPRRHGTQASVTSTDPRHTIYIPQASVPEDIRTCLMEEIAQGLGPANDLWGVGPSIFNDDNAHAWPTALDYLMLRVLYQPELRSGATREETEGAALAVLARLNPAGEGAAPLPAWRARELSGWREVMQGLHRRDADGDGTLARKALAIAEARAPGSAQHCQSLVTLGDALEPDEALAVYDRARPICEAVHGPDDIRLASLDLDRAEALMQADRAPEARALVERVLPVFAAHGQADAVAWIYHLAADGYSLDGDEGRAATARGLSLAWAAYAFGPDHATLAAWRAEWGIGS